MKGYKKKFLFSLVAMAIICLVALLGPLGKTFELRRQSEKMAQDLEKLSEAPERIAMVKQQLDWLDLSVGFNDSLNFDQRDLFVYLAGCASKNKVVVREIPDRHLYREREMMIETHFFKLEGAYINLLKVVFELEKNLKSYSIASVSFYRVQDKRTQKHELIMELFIQGIRKQ